MTDNELIDKAQGIARCLSYNDTKPVAGAKHTIHELCHRLGAKTLRIHRKDGGLLLVTSYGQSRFLTFSEHILYRLFGVVPPINGWRGDEQ